MEFTFRAKIYKVGINLCVKVPTRITNTMKPTKGYITVTGKIEGHPFDQTLVPVKNEPYRLYVNGLMLKGAGVGLGQTVSFTLEQSFKPKKYNVAMPKEFKSRMVEQDLFPTFKALIPSRRKEILKYLNYLKTTEARERNMRKILDELRKIKGS